MIKRGQMRSLPAFLALLWMMPAQSQRRTASTNHALVLGTLATGATVSFVKSAANEWGIEISGRNNPHVVQEQPARLEVYSDAQDIRQLTSGYKTVTLTGGVAIGRADLTLSSAVNFRVEDRWSLIGAVVSVHRRLDVKGNGSGGFDSAVMLETKPDVTWPDIDFLAPGQLYGDPTNDGIRAAGGPMNYKDRRLSFREDYLSAPLIALSFRNGTSISVLDPSPRGDTTTAESRAPTGTVLTDQRFLFGALGAHEAQDGGVEFGFWLPGTISDFAGPARRSAADPRPEPSELPVRAWRRRYNPIKQGFKQDYDVSFRFGRDEQFRDVTRDAYRWAWSTLKPQVTYLDLPLVQRTLIDFLEARIVSVDGRTGIPYLLDARTGEYMDRADAKRAALGFCAKNIEAADQLLEESDHDPSPRGQKMRQSALDIISTFIRVLGPMSPPAGDGFNLYTGKLEQAVWSIDKQFLRTPSDDMLVLVNAYRREKAEGRDHPEWLHWAQGYADWLLTQQRADGSWPRTWKPGTSDVAQPSGSGSYSPPPLMLALYRETGENTYRESALRAGEYLWSDWGTRGVYAGGAVDGSSVHLNTDKEGGMLSLLAFESLYDATKDPKWLKRAEAAGDYAETWIWIWNVPMPADADNSTIEWKVGVPTVGLQGIGAAGSGGTDEYLDWATPLFAKLYEDTKDPHYLDVARILLHNTKAMLAMPGRTYGMLGPGWQQEHWLMSSNRGYGQAGKWLPWLTTNHLHSIMALKDYDPVLYKQLSTKPAAGSAKLDP